MKQIKKLTLCFIAIFCLTTLVGCKAEAVAEKDMLELAKDKNEIIWGIKYDTRLFGMMNIETREVEGFDIDIAKALTKEILGEDGEATFVEVTSKTRIPLLKNGNINAIIATMTITEERRKQVDFSEVYFAAGQSLLVEKGSPLTGVSDLTSDHTVLVVKGSTSAINIREAAPDANILELENYAECFTALQSGQGDAMTTDNAILLGMCVENPNYHLVGGTFTEEPYGIAINKEQNSLLEEVNNALQRLHDNGTYDEIFKKWFPDSDDGKVQS